jgi:hypothetical protein
MPDISKRKRKEEGCDTRLNIKPPCDIKPKEIRP